MEHKIGIIYKLMFSLSVRKRQIAFGRSNQKTNLLAAKLYRAWAVSQNK